MRKITTFILRLLVDTDEPQVLRGTVRPVAHDGEYPFVDEPSLLYLLHQMTRVVQVSGTDREGENASDFREEELK